MVRVPSSPTPHWLTAVLGELPSAVLVLEAPTSQAVFWNDQATRAWPSFLQCPPALADVDLVRCQLYRADGRRYGAENWPAARSLSSASAVMEEVRLTTPDDTETHVEMRCTPMCDAGGQVVAVMAMSQDVTARRRAEQALKASQARFESLYQDAPDMFASVTVDRQEIVQCNETLIRATGFSRDELLHRSIRELHHPGCWLDLAVTLDLVRRAGRVRDQELQLLCKNGTTMDVSLSVAAIRDEKDNLYYRSTWRDITERVAAQLVIDQKQTQLEHSQLELQALAGRLLTAQEDERRRISRELHDDFNQRLAMLTLEIETLHQELPESRKETIERLGALRDGIVSLSDAVHSLAYQLHASILDDLGLSAALESYLAAYKRRESIDVEFTRSDVIDALPADVASCLYRVAQEALRNVARHASATRVTVKVEEHAEGISMAVSDDGAGFDIPSPQDAGSHLGIVGMEERVRLVNGRLRLSSRPGEGTRIVVWVPMPQAVGDTNSDAPG